MSADMRTAHFAGWFHRGESGGYIHVVHDEAGQPVMGSFNLGEITELAEMAGHAWPADDRVEVRYVIEARRGPDRPWAEMWSALADETWENGVPEHYAAETLNGFRHAGLEWQLTRRTTLTAVEVIGPEWVDRGDTGA